MTPKAETQQIQIQRDQDAHKSSFWNMVTGIATTAAAAGLVGLVVLALGLQNTVTQLNTKIEQWGHVPQDVRELKEWKASVDTWIGLGEPYTRDMATRDLAPIVEKVNDHELRIRYVERKVPTS